MTRGLSHGFLETPTDVLQVRGLNLLGPRKLSHLPVAGLGVSPQLLSIKDTTSREGQSEHTSGQQNQEVGKQETPESCSRDA